MDEIGGSPAAYRRKQLGRWAAILLAVGWVVALVTGLGERSTVIAVIITAVGVIGFVVVAVFVFWQGIGSTRLSTAYRRFAERHGFDYSPDGDRSLLVGLDQLASRDGSESASAIDVVSGTVDGQRFALFRYAVPAGRAGSGMHIDVAVVRFDLPAPLTSLWIRPEGLPTTVTPGLMTTDVDIENERFNRYWRVENAGDQSARKLASDLLNPRAVQALLAVEPFDWRIDADVLYSWETLAEPPEKLLPRIQALAGVVAAAPSFLWTDGGADPDGSPAHG